MINLNTAIEIAKNVPRITKLEVTEVQDFWKTTDRHGNALVPYCAVQVTLYGAGSVPFLTPYTLYIRDTAPSLVLAVNATPGGIDDQFLLVSTSLPDNPYTALSNAWSGTTNPATRAGRMKAIEALLVTVGALPAAFAGT
jgi:hypothetical protein